MPNGRDIRVATGRRNELKGTRDQSLLDAAASSAVSFALS